MRNTPDIARPFAPLPVLRPPISRLHAPARMVNNEDGDRLELRELPPVMGGEGHPDFTPKPLRRPGVVVILLMMLAALLGAVELMGGEDGDE